MSKFKALLLAAGLTLAGSPAVAAKVGEAAPPFTVTTFDGQTISSADLRGHVVILNYWATWCAPCRVELPTMDVYARRRRDVRIYAVTVEGSVPAAKLKPLASVLSFPLVSKLKGRGYGAIKGAVPTNYVIDKRGVVRYAQAGAFDAEDLDTIVSPLLAEPAPQMVAAAAPGAGGRAP